MTSQQVKQQIIELGPWFYEFDLGKGLRTRSKLPKDVQGIFNTRLTMLKEVIEEYFSGRLEKISCVDVGCHEGFYSMAMAGMGISRVLGIDFRERNIAKARFVTNTTGCANVDFEVGNCEDLLVREQAPFELSLFLGVLYHLENPMRCLRNIAAATSELCIIETQVIDEISGSTEWGAKEWKRPYRGTLALIDESSEFAADNAETGSSPMAICPSPKALLFMLEQAGFARAEFIDPPPEAYEQHWRRKRVVCAAYK